MLEPKPKKLQMLGKFASVQPDWDQRDENAVDYIKNKPFYEYIDIGDVFVEEQTFTHDATRGGHTIMTDSNRTPASGQTFCITFDGVEYCLDVGMCQGPNESNQEYFIGNASIRYPELGNNGLPFYLYITYWGVYVFMVYTTSGEHTIKIVDAVRTVKQLPEGAIPDTIARKTDIPEPPKQIQSDWNQNDAAAIDYVKNRTHYMTLVEVPIEGNLVYDGVHVSSVNGEHNFHKMCEVEGKPEEYQITLFGGTTNANKVIDIADVVNDCSEYFVDYGPSPGWLVVREHIDGERYNLYVGSANNDTYNGVTFSGSVGVNQVQPLDEKYIPDTIARKTDIPEQVQSDWAITDATNVAYIKNKPFYEYLGPGDVFVEEQTFNNNGSGIRSSISADSYQTRDVGQTFYITFDGKEYRETTRMVTLRNGSTEIGIGNASYRNRTLDDNGLPFYVACEYRRFDVYTTMGEHTIHIVEETVITKPISDIYIPDTIARKTDIPSKVSAVPDAAGDTPTAAEFNALLTALRNAGYLADS